MITLVIAFLLALCLLSLIIGTIIQIIRGWKD